MSAFTHSHRTPVGVGTVSRWCCNTSWSGFRDSLHIHDLSDINSSPSSAVVLGLDRKVPITTEAGQKVPHRSVDIVLQVQDFMKSHVCV